MSGNKNDMNVQRNCTTLFNAQESILEPEASEQM